MDNLLLWNSFLKGDKDAFREIYIYYYQVLFSYGMRRINKADTVRDCIQDLFINLWTKRSGIGPTNNIKLYLLASLRNHLFQLGLKGQQLQQVQLEHAEEFKLDFDPESIIIARENMTERARKIISALDKLSARQKEVLYLHYFEELSHEEIAELLNLSIKGIYKVKYRGLEALRLLLGVSKSELLIILLLSRIDFIHCQPLSFNFLQKI